VPEGVRSLDAVAKRKFSALPPAPGSAFDVRGEQALSKAG